MNIVSRAYPKCLRSIRNALAVASNHTVATADANRRVARCVVVAQCPTDDAGHLPEGTPFGRPVIDGEYVERPDRFVERAWNSMTSSALDITVWIHDSIPNDGREYEVSVGYYRWLMNTRLVSRTLYLLVPEESGSNPLDRSVKLY